MVVVKVGLISYFGVCIQKSKRADALFFCGVHSVYVCVSELSRDIIDG